MQMSPIPAAPAPEAWRKPDQINAVLMDKARALESVFLSEMLSHAGLGAGLGAGTDTESGGFGGGIGEQQFASFLRQEQADLMVRRGGIGLAEQLYRAMTRDPA